MRQDQCLIGKVQRQGRVTPAPTFSRILIFSIFSRIEREASSVPRYSSREHNKQQKQCCPVINIVAYRRPWVYKLSPAAHDHDPPNTAKMNPGYTFVIPLPRKLKMKKHLNAIFT